MSKRNNDATDVKDTVFAGIASKGQALKVIASIAKRGRTLDKDIHTVASYGIAHARDHGDLTILNKLYVAMPKSGRREGLKAWVREFAPVKWNKDKEQFAMVSKKNLPENWKVEEAHATPFWEFEGSREVAAADITVERLMNSFANRFKKYVAQQKAKGQPIPSQDNIEDQLHKVLNTVLSA